MKARTCPKCGYKHPALDYVRTALFSPKPNNWHCPECNESLTFNRKRRMVISMSPMVLVTILVSMGSEIKSILDINFFAFFLIVIALMALLFSFALAFEKFEVQEGDGER
ncbi:MAG TPA: hypothetical protein PLC17_00440 [Tenuifilaceae bacterium]|nr:hypothetical protein [Tenuifilaceae bacterium]